MNIWNIIAKSLTLIGSLGIFLYGMKLMSEALQKVAGNKMRNILGRISSNRFKGVFTGMFVTSIIQSSSATTVMVVSFVNAGLLSLGGSIGIIMGANIGTTATAWLVSLLGFKIKMNLIAVPLVGLALPMLFSKVSSRKSWGEFIIGFSILFLGLEFLKDSVPDIKEYPNVLEFVAQFTGNGIFSTLFFVLVGTIFTIIIQSSSATMAVTIVMCHNGLISFDIAAAMVLGENIGTTITANLAAMVANVSARRAAMAHSVFNLIGVIWMLFVFNPVLRIISNVVTGIEGVSPFTSVASIPIALSIFHSSFNIANTILLIGFVKYIEKLVVKIIPNKIEDDEEFRLRFIDTRFLSTSELSTTQAMQEISVMGKRIARMFDFIPILLNPDRDKKDENLAERLQKYEEISDRMEVEIAKYLTKTAEGSISREASIEIRAMLDIIDNLESVADQCYQMGLSIENKNQQKSWFTQEMRDNLNKMFDLVKEALKIMNENLSNDYAKCQLKPAMEMELKINQLRDELRKQHFEDIKNAEYPYQTGIIYNQMISLCEKTGDYIINITEAITNKRF